MIVLVDIVRIFAGRLWHDGGGLCRGVFEVERG